MPNSNQVLGTIISLVLSYEQLCTLLGEVPNTAEHPKSASYAPCDGRSIAHSALHDAIPALVLAPDLRGKFLRGLNHIAATGEPGYNPETSDADGEAHHRKVLEYQDDQVRLHNHPARGIIQGSVSGSNGTRDVDNGSQKMNSDPQYGAHNVSIIMDGYGGTETRPKNVAVYFFIKVN